jgi:hypothetical protein
MKNKKGSIHIDWVVSIGIFLTYIILLLTFIKPSYEPAFEGDVLTNLVVDKFYEEVGWEVKKSLLSFECDGGGAYKLDGGLSSYIPDVDNYNIVLKDRDSNGDYIRAEYKPDLTIKLFDGKDKFWVFSNEDQSYEPPVPKDPGDPLGNIVCTKIGAANPIVFKGVSESKMDGLNVSKIADNFPEFRQFKVRVLESEGGFRECFVKGLVGKQNEAECAKADIPNDAVVYGVDIGAAILDKNGELEQVILNVQIW